MKMPSAESTTNGAPKSSIASKDKKRKATDAAGKQPVEKRKATSSSRSSRSSKTEHNIDKAEILQYLLSEKAAAPSKPKDESEDIDAHAKENRAYKTYTSTVFSPFEELLAALILSRPIGHRLGLRSIRTLYNKPYNLTTPETIRAAGTDGVLEALEAARTQHRQKTAKEIVGLADIVVEHMSANKSAKDTSLNKLRADCTEKSQKERDTLIHLVKGMARTGADIFARRIQGVWPEWYPFADERTLDATTQLGLGGDVKELASLIEQHWAQLKGVVSKKGTEEEQKRAALVTVLDRATGLSLEGNIDQARKAAAG